MYTLHSCISGIVKVLFGFLVVAFVIEIKFDSVYIYILENCVIGKIILQVSLYHSLACKPPSCYESHNTKICKLFSVLVHFMLKYFSNKKSTKILA